MRVQRARQRAFGTRNAFFVTLSNSCCRDNLLLHGAGGIETMLIAGVPGVAYPGCCQEGSVAVTTCDLTCVQYMQSMHVYIAGTPFEYKGGAINC